MQKNNTDDKVLITDLTMDKLYPNVINDVILNILDNKAEIHLPPTMIGEKYKHWMRGRGGIFYKDLKNFTNNKQLAKYILIEEKDSRLIVRIIEDSEVDVFSTYKLIDGKLKDKNYMILKSLKTDESLTATIRTTILDEVEEKTIDIPVDGDIIETHDNVALFED